MKKAKYIIFDMNGLEIPIVFCPILEHVQIANKFNFPILSAGFCHLHPYEPMWEVSGESVSLKKKSRKEDAQILNDNLERDI